MEDALRMHGRDFHRSRDFTKRIISSGKGMLQKNVTDQ
jgi:hypothetical protein